jgi:hypothetical protein
VAGARLGFGGSLIVARWERKAAAEAEARRANASALAERRRAYAAYLGAVYSIVGELRGIGRTEHPAPSGLVGRSKSLMPCAKRREWSWTCPGVDGFPIAMRVQLESSFALVQVLDVGVDVRAVVSEANEYVIALGETMTPGADRAGARVLRAARAGGRSPLGRGRQERTGVGEHPLVHLLPPRCALSVLRP